MQYTTVTGLIMGLALAFGHCATPTALLGQQQEAEVSILEETLESYARSYREINAVRDEIHAELAANTNKSESAQARLRERMIEDVAAVLESQGLTQEEYDQITFMVSVDLHHRERFQAILVRLQSDSQ